MAGITKALTNALAATTRNAGRGGCAHVAKGFASAARVFAPVAPYAAGVQFMVHSAASAQQFGHGIKYFAEQSAMKDLLATASAQEQAEVAKVLLRPFADAIVDQDMAVRHLLDGVFETGVEAWSETALRNVLNGIIRAGGLIHLSLECEARARDLPARDVGQALQVYDLMDRSFPRLPKKLTRALVKSRLRQSDSPISVSPDASDALSSDPLALNYFHELGAHLRRHQIYPLSSARVSCAFLSDFLLGRPSLDLPRRDEQTPGDEGAGGCCVPMTLLIGALSVRRNPMGVYQYGEHISAVHSKTGVVCDSMKNKLRLSHSSLWQEAGYLMSVEKPAPLRGSLATLVHNLGICEENKDAGRALLQTSLRISPSVPALMAISSHFDPLGEQCLRHVEQAEQIRARQPTVLGWKGFLLFGRGKYAEALPLLKMALQIDAQQKKTIRRMENFSMPPLLPPRLVPLFTALVKAIEES